MNSIINTHTPISGNIVLGVWESETKGNHKIVISCFLLEIAWNSLYFPQMTYFPCHISTSTAEHGLCPCVVNKSHIFYQPGYKLCCVAKISLCLRCWCMFSAYLLNWSHAKLHHSFIYILKGISNVQSW